LKNALYFCFYVHIMRVKISIEWYNFLAPKIFVIMFLNVTNDCRFYNQQVLRHHNNHSVLKTFNDAIFSSELGL
jgi:hypothetical protein